MERRTFLHGPGPVERESSRSGEWVKGGAIAPCQGSRELDGSLGRWGARERDSTLASDQPAKRVTGAVMARCQTAPRAGGMQRGRASGSPCQDGAGGMTAHILRSALCGSFFFLSSCTTFVPLVRSRSSQVMLWTDNRLNANPFDTSSLAYIVRPAQQTEHFYGPLRKGRQSRQATLTWLR